MENKKIFCFICKKMREHLLSPIIHGAMRSFRIATCLECSHAHEIDEVE